MFLVASWGSSGAGKTSVALALAAAMAKRHKDVLVLSTESRTPSLPVWMPTVSGLTDRNSVTELLSQTNITEASLKDRMCKHPHSNHIYFMGVGSGQIAALTYGPPKREAVMNLLNVLQQSPYDYIIIDCDSNPVLDVTTMIALEWAKFGICTLTADVKGYEYLKAQMAWLGNSETFRVEDFHHIINMETKTTPIAESKALFQNIRYQLPYSTAVRDKMTAGELLSGFHDMGGIELERQISLILDDLEEKERYGKE